MKRDSSVGRLEFPFVRGQLLLHNSLAVTGMAIYAHTLGPSQADTPIKEKRGTVHWAECKPIEFETQWPLVLYLQIFLRPIHTLGPRH